MASPLEEHEATMLLIRAYLVIQTPNDVLVDKLGLDIPPSPDITLEEIHGDSVRISWKHQDIFNPLALYAIHINGSRAGEARRTENAASLHGLQPGTYYDIRVFAISSTGFQTPSTILHVRTSPRPKQPDDDVKEEIQPPYIKTYSTRAAAPSSPLSAPPMTRETSAGANTSRRLTGAKRNAPVSPGHVADQMELRESEDVYGPNSEDESQTSLTQLQSQLESVKRQIDAMEADVVKEDEEFATTHGELKHEKEITAARLEERNEASKHLRTQINQHEGRKSALNKERSKKEAMLAQKEREQRGRRDDIAKWDELSRNHQDHLEEIEKEKQAVILDFESKIKDARAKIKAEEVEVETIGASNEETKHQLKILSQNSNASHIGQSDEANGSDLRQHEKDISWQNKLNEWAATQASLSRDMAIARQQFEVANSRLSHLKELRRSEGSNNFIPPVALNLDLARRDPLNRRARQRSSLTSNLSSPNPLLEHEIYGSISTGSPTSIAAQFNLNNGVLNFSHEAVPPQDDIENLIGPVPTSPKEVDLLPKDLLQDNPADDDRMIDNNSDERISSPSSLSKRFSGLVQPNVHSEGVMHDAISPVSSSSRPASIFTSPRSSLYHLPESEPRPNGSSDSPHVPPDYSDTAQSASRKLVSSLFSFNRQRGKTIADEPPLLGSLKPGQSQSFPRNLGDSVDDLDSQRKRRSSHASTFFPRATDTGEKNTEPVPIRRGMATLFGSSKLHPAVLANLGRSSNQKDSLNPLNPRTESIDASIHSTFRNENSISRASSLRSFDNSQLPRPSTDNSALLLSLAEKSDRGTSPLGAADWTTPWSRNASRRPSIQHGSSGHLPLDPPLENEGLVEPSREAPRRLQAPIGTRPKSASQKAPPPPKLNPTAAPFKASSFFRKSEKDKERSASKPVAPPFPNDSQASISSDASPTSARKSKENQSINTLESMVESPDVLERTASGTPSEGTPSKETLIQKLTRKSSSTKFNSWKGKDKGSKFPKKGDTNTSNDFDEDNGSDSQLGRSMDSATSNAPEKDKSARSSLSFSFMKAARKVDKRKTQDVSESSEVGESETGDESLVDEAG